MDDLALASRIKANLVLNRATEALEIEVVAHSGVIAVKGRLTGVDQFREIEQIAKATPGVKGVNMDELFPPRPD